MMLKIVNGVAVKMTAEEIKEYNEQLEKSNTKAAIMESRKPLTEAEVLAMLIPTQINTLDVDNNTALRMINYYPSWASGVSYATGFKVKYNNRLYKVLQAHTSQEGWQPDLAASLWTEINEVHSGTLEDPIGYGGNMALEKDKYYLENNIIYLCSRDTINPIYNSLSELIGLYVEEVYRL
jgi:hypothetical protein